MVVEVGFLGGDRSRSDEGGVVLRPFQEWKGEGHREVAARASQRRRRRPVDPGRKTARRGWLGRPKAEA
jgi:hypothetical protein